MHDIWIFTFLIKHDILNRFAPVISPHEVPSIWNFECIPLRWSGLGSWKIKGTDESKLWGRIYLLVPLTHHDPCNTVSLILSYIISVEPTLWVGLDIQDIFMSKLKFLNKSRSVRAKKKAQQVIGWRRPLIPPSIKEIFFFFSFFFFVCLFTLF